MNLLAFIQWNPGVEVFSLGALHIRYYSLCWMIGLLLAYLLVQRQYKQQGIRNEVFEPLFLYTFFGVLIGARLGHCLFYQPEYFIPHPLEMILPFRHTASGWTFTGYEGLASHGGIIGMLIAFWLYVRRTKMNYIRVLDNIALAAPVTACFIRLGNLMNSEIVGLPTNVPWGFIFVHNGEDFARHPAQLYEALFYLCIFGLQRFLYHKYPQRMGSGLFFGVCLSTIFIFRFLVEFIKADQVDFEQGMVLNMGQWLSIPLIILGVAFMIGGKWLCKLSDDGRIRPELLINGKAGKK